VRSDFAKRITIAWQKTVQSILEVGRLLLAAKKKLPHGDFTAMVESDLPFSIRTAECLMSIARHPRLAKANPHTCASLPSSWRALYELSRLPARQFVAALRARRIFADMTVSEASHLRATVERTPVPAQPTPGLLSVPATVTHTVIPARAVFYRGETKSIPTLSEDVLRSLEKQRHATEEKRHANEIIDAICAVTEADLEPLVKQLTSHRIADIEKVKQSIELLRRLGERLSGATIVPLHSG
jgi:hypothetical protein